MTMAASSRAIRPLSNKLYCNYLVFGSVQSCTLSGRPFSTTPRILDEQETVQKVRRRRTDRIPYYELDPNKVRIRRHEQALLRTGRVPIGSRRRRAALSLLPVQIPFEQLPYQCFQEARKVLAEDREEKLKKIATQRARLAHLEAQDANALGGDNRKTVKVLSMRKELENLKIHADYNDPLVKKRFEDGDGDMNKPIYRFLADREWRKYRYLVTEQRIKQFNIVPDILPKLEPTAEVKLMYGRKTYQTGSIIDSSITEKLPKLEVQVFDKGERLITVVCLDADVPDLEKDSFDYRCHYIASNISISPTKRSLPLAMLKDEHTILPWLVPHAQKGTPYHRMPIFVLEQDPENPLVPEQVKAWSKLKRDGFKLRAFIDKYNLRPIGFNMFRTVWDENMKAVMQKAGIPGWDVELKRKKPLSLPYKKKDSERYR
ncbi:PEBP-like protein [Pseudovirgaria hyperparasitica]|uniref:Large ribosomal subunit protein mL38 n=1 Tax=Pseudovirgaria hyperparasitica TaxID=470096 RepID=A0A6A6W7M6_9PEZI|nr:PEBP-like protein [Pseudovirgaria hyperparasitica]KAF2758898.1 PEBP-like protein [Pseudovirgaria hyperparasitica]